MFLSSQEIFNKVATHLRTQGVQSLSDDGTCLYRSPDGLKCAIGCLIRDEFFDLAWNFESIYHRDVQEALVNSGVSANVDFELLAALQLTHDVDEPETWSSSLHAIAIRFDLEDPDYTEDA